MISIIIPTLNEEYLLPELLSSIRRQDFKDYEIIITDAGSVDKTIKISRDNGCRVIKGGLPGEGRNKGVEISNGDLLLFLDADVTLPIDFFNPVLKEFKERGLDLGSFCLVPESKKILFNIFYNIPIIVLEKILPHAAQGILVKKDIFKKLNGYDESIKMAEDHDLARRAKKIGKYGIIRSKKIHVSDRRFKKDGWIKTAFIYFISEVYIIFKGPIRSDIFKYKFGHYFEKKDK